MYGSWFARFGVYPEMERDVEVDEVDESYYYWRLNRSYAHHGLGKF